jgi:hypothetical protein
MKRIQLIEWGIIAIALIFGYKAFEGFLSLIMQFIAIIISGDEIYPLFIAFLLSAIYFVCLVVLIRNSRTIAVYLNGPQKGEDDIHFKIGKRPLLQVILIGICSFTIITNVANVIYFIVKAFKDEAGGDAGMNKYLMLTRDQTSIPAIISAIQIVFAIIIIYYSKNIAYTLIRKNEVDELTLDSKSES